MPLWRKLMIVKIIYIFFLFCAYCYQFLSYENKLQKQYYEWNRFIKLLWKNKKMLFYKVFIFIITLFISFFPFHIYFFYLPFLFFVDKIEKKILSFVWTKRVIRHMAIFLSLSFISLKILSFYSLKIIIFLSILNFLVVFIIAYLFSIFLEFMITKKFIHRAKKKLSMMQSLKIICITGSYGKTSTKNYIYEILKRNYRVCYSKASYNSLKGVLLTINENLKDYHEILLLEIGVDRKNGMNKFLHFLNPDIGIITSIGPQHLTTFKTIKNIAMEKTKLLKHLSKSSTAIVNQDDYYLKSLHLDCNCIFVSKEKKCDIYIQNVCQKQHQISFDLHINQSTYFCVTQILGMHHLMNLLLAIGCAKALQIDDETILNTIPHLSNIAHRLSLKYEENLTIIDDSYNSNVEGFCAAIEVLSSFEGKKVLLTPGLIETNHMQTKFYQKISNLFNQTCDLVVLIGKNSLEIKKYCTVPWIYFDTYQQGYSYVKQESLKNKIVVLIENDLPDIYL